MAYLMGQPFGFAISNFTRLPSSVLLPTVFMRLEGYVISG